MSQFRNNLLATSSLGNNRIIYSLDSNIITLGEDIMVYDHYLEKFGVLLGSTIKLIQMRIFFQKQILISQSNGLIVLMESIYMLLL